MPETLNDASPQRKARAAGLCWLITFIACAFAMFMGGSIVVNGNAAANARNILANESVFRVGVSANLIATICYLLTTILVYEVFKPVNRTVSSVAAWFSFLGCAVGAVVSLLNFTPLALLKGSAHLAVFTTEQLQALALTSFNLGARANEIALLFFGLHIGLVGYLIVASSLVPRTLGAFLILGDICYELNSFASFLAAPFARSFFPFVLLPAFFAELALSLWLLVKGLSGLTVDQHAPAGRLTQSLT